MPGDKLRFRFAKTGTLRLLSHHDLMRCFERMLRRAALPFKSTAGFHPTPRVVFALSLSLGVEACDEVVEIEFLQPLEPDDVLAALKAQSPIGLTFTRATVVPMKVTARPRRIVYQLDLPADRAEAIASRCGELLAADQLWVNRLKPSPKQLNIRPYLRNLSLERDAAGVARLVVELWVTQTGTARIDELLNFLDLAEVRDAGAVVTRTTVELQDEVADTDPADVPPDGPADTRPLSPEAIARLAKPPEEHATAVGWGASPAGPVVE